MAPFWVALVHWIVLVKELQGNDKVRVLDMVADLPLGGYFAPANANELWLATTDLLAHHFPCTHTSFVYHIMKLQVRCGESCFYGGINEYMSVFRNAMQFATDDLDLMAVPDKMAQMLCTMFDKMSAPRHGAVETGLEFSPFAMPLFVQHGLTFASARAADNYVGDANLNLPRMCSRTTTVRHQAYTSVLARMTTAQVRNQQRKQEAELQSELHTSHMALEKARCKKHMQIANTSSLVYMLHLLGPFLMDLVCMVVHENLCGYRDAIDCVFVLAMIVTALIALYSARTMCIMWTHSDWCTHMLPMLMQVLTLVCMIMFFMAPHDSQKIMRLWGCEESCAQPNCPA